MNYANIAYYECADYDYQHGCCRVICEKNLLSKVKCCMACSQEDCTKRSKCKYFFNIVMPSFEVAERSKKRKK